MNEDIGTLKQQVISFIETLAEQTPVAQSVVEPGVEIKLYGAIGDEMNATDAKSVTDIIDQAEGVINLRINSPGGSFYDGVAIYNALRNSSSTVHAYVEGMAASAASFIAMAADKVYMNPISSMMIHEPTTASAGREEELRSTADNLKSIKDMLVNAYMEKSGMALDVLVSMLKKTTWFSADQAIKAGLADEIYVGEDPATDRVENAWEPTVYWQQQYAASLSSLRTEACLPLPPKVEESEMAEDKVDATQVAAQNDVDELAQIKATYEARLAESVAKVEAAAKAERNRLRDIDAMTLPGYEVMAEKAKYEDPVDPGEFAKAMLEAERKTRRDAIVALSEDEPKAAAIAVEPLKIEPKSSDPIRALWDSSEDIRNEFAEFEDFKAYKEYEQAS